MAKARFPVFATEASAGKKVGKAGSSSIQRSVETGMAVEYPRGGSAMNRQASRESTDGSMNSYSSEGKYVHAENIAKTQDNTQRALSVFLYYLLLALLAIRIDRFCFVLLAAGNTESYLSKQQTSNAVKNFWKRFLLIL